MATNTLVVLAAGIGSRYGGLKQIDPIGPNGEIIISYSIYDAIQAGFDKVVFIIREDLEKPFREHIGQDVEKQIETEYVFQELTDIPSGFEVPENREKPWGTAHAVLCCRDVIDSPFAVINADDFYGRGAFQLLGDFLKNSSNDLWEYCLIGYILKNTVSPHGHVARGTCSTDSNGYLTDIVERKMVQPFDGAIKYSEDKGETWNEIDSNTLVSMNMWGFTPTILDEMEPQFEEFLKKELEDPKSEFLLPDSVGELLDANKAKVKVLKTDERWYGVTYQEDKPRVQEAVRELVQQGVYPERLFG